MEKKYIKAQALAIVMVVLVVASIIGISLFSRMSKDKQGAVNQQDSSLAEEQADAILDMFIGADIVRLEDEVEAITAPLDNINDIKGLFDLIGVDKTALPDEGWCVSDQGSSINLSLSKTGDTDFIEVQPGSVRSYNLDGAEISPFEGGVCACDDVGCSTECDDHVPCFLRLRLKTNSDYSIFIIKFVARDDDTGEFSEWDQKYCIGQDGAGCDSGSISSEIVSYLSDFIDGGDVLDWSEDLGGAFEKDINLGRKIYNENVVQIRILPLYGTLSVADYFQDGQLSCINRDFSSIKISAEVTCNGSYRGKEMYLPGSGNLGYSSLFDYAIYDNGLFQL